MMSVFIIVSLSFLVLSSLELSLPVVARHGLHTFATRDDDACAVVSISCRMMRLISECLLQWHHHVEVRRGDAQSAADGLKLVGAGGVLSAGHGRGEGVAEDEREGGILVDGIEQFGHAAMRERRVADDGHGRPQSGVGGTFGHADARTHVHTTVDGVKGAMKPSV
jgi:hypothetical protein